MTINVRELLEIKELNSIKIVAGHSGLEKPIEYVNVMDTVNITNWLKGKELLLVCGVFKSEPNICKNIIKNVAKKNVSAIGTKFKTCFGSIPVEMIEQSNKYSIPLLDIPSEFSWTDIMAPVYNAIINKKTKLMERYDFLYDLIYGNITSRELIINKARNYNWNFCPNFFIIIYSVFKQKQTAEKNIDESTYTKNKLNIMDNIEYLTINYFSNCISFKKGHSIIALLPENIPNNVNNVKKLITEILSKANYDDNSIGISAGISRIYPIENIYIAYNEAQTAIELSSIIKGKDCVIDFNELGLYRILMSRKNDKDTRDFYSKTIEPLVLYDKENCTQYVHALEAFLEHGTKQGAEMLYIHPNTLRYRLKKIEEITGKSLDNYDDQLDLQIGLKLEKLLNK